jgi:pilus assembly protein CpaE
MSKITKDLFSADMFPLGETAPPVPQRGQSSRRVLAIGEALAPLAQGPLFGAAMEVAGLDRLPGLRRDSADIVLIDADAWPIEALTPAVAALAATPASPPVLLIGSHLPAGLVRSLLKHPRSDVLETPFAPDQLVAALEGLLAQAAAAPAPTIGQSHKSRCWAVTGAVGGAGATTLAIEMATALASRVRKDRSVCLVDLNLVDGAAAAYLGATATLKLAEFGPAAERIDQSLLQAFAVPVFKGLDLLASLREPNGFEMVSREAVLRILEVACDTYDWVIVDIPRHRRAWTLEALSGCDEVLVVSELTVPALIAARSLADEIEDGLGSGRPPRIVLNRLASRMFGPAPSMAEAERALQRKAEAGIASDWEAAAASVNLGGPISHHRPRSRIVRDVATLVDRLMAEDERRNAAASRAA